MFWAMVLSLTLVMEVSQRRPYIAAGLAHTDIAFCLQGYDVVMVSISRALPEPCA